ncbi:MAG: hypothetical protein QG636_588 [Patescibacteria group bacterium]|nr:hypothetical protein [Patescibacteria group bacterium]
MEQGFSAIPNKAEKPRSETAVVIENLLGILSQEAVDIYSALPLMQTREEYEEGIARFNELGAAQLDRVDEKRREQIENEKLDKRQIETVIELPPYGRTLRITRAANGIVTLAST